MDGVSELEGVSPEDLKITPEVTPVEKPEKKRPLLDSLKERIANSLPQEAARNIDIVSRLRNLASNPRTAELMIKGLEAGIFIGALTGVFGEVQNQQFLSNALTISKGMMGMPAFEASANVPAQMKLASEMLNILGAPSIVGDVTKALELAPDLKLQQKTAKVKEYSMAKAGRMKEVFTGISNRANLEMRDFQTNSKDILGAMSTFGVQGPAPTAFATA